MAARAAVRPRPQGLARLWTTGWLRRLVQLYFVLFIARVAIEKVIVGEESTIFAASPEAFCPLGGFEGLFKFVTTGGLFIAHTHWSNMILAISILATALVAKSAFCGWICPFGAVQQLVRGAARTLGVAGRTPPGWFDRPARYFKYVVMVWALFGAGYTGTLVFRDVDPYIALVAPIEAGFGVSTVVLAITLLSSAVVERAWCRYACPLGALIGLVGRASLIKVERDAEACTNCGLCDRRCPTNVRVSTATRIATPECNNCLSCTEVCRFGALEPRLVTMGGGHRAG